LIFDIEDLVMYYIDIKFRRKVMTKDIALSKIFYGKNVRLTDDFRVNLSVTNSGAP